MKKKPVIKPEIIPDVKTYNAKFLTNFEGNLNNWHIKARKGDIVEGISELNYKWLLQFKVIE